MDRALLYAFIFYSFSSMSVAQDILSVDRSVTSNLELSFSNEKDIRPKISDFKIVNYVLMSGEEGARWAVVTLKNTAAGNRIFHEEQILALFANGDRLHPLEMKETFDGFESISLTLSFGNNVFPILEIVTRE